MELRLIFPEKLTEKGRGIYLIGESGGVAARDFEIFTKQEGEKNGEREKWKII